MSRDCGICQACRKAGRVTQAQEVDHIVPLDQGGGNDELNLQALCLTCHADKSAYERAEAAKYQGHTQA